MHPPLAFFLCSFINMFEINGKMNFNKSAFPLPDDRDKGDNKTKA